MPILLELSTSCGGELQGLPDPGKGSGLNPLKWSYAFHLRDNGTVHNWGTRVFSGEKGGKRDTY